MNVLVASIISGVVLIWLIIVILKFKNKYITATTAVYLSGTVTILILSAVMSAIPLVFVIISEISILSVYGITMFAVIRISRNIGEILKEVEQGKVKAIKDENEEREDEEEKPDQGNT